MNQENSQSGTNSTIFSLSSGVGVAGVAVVRVSGSQAKAVFSSMVSGGFEPRQAHLRAIRHPVSGEILDHGLVLWMPGPGSFTGEDCLELQVHGGVATTTAILQALSCLRGFRIAQPGEFTRRAFINGRLDLVEIEGLGDLLSAQTEEQRRQALRQSAGEVSVIFEGWRKQLISILARCEACVDFVEEEDVNEQVLDTLKEDLIRLRNDMSLHLENGAKGRSVRHGVRVVLMGAPNVGKSSLLNAIAQRDVAIVSDKPGTTRDSIEVVLHLSGLPVIFTDTAGLRDKSDDEIENAGMARTKQIGDEADLILWISEVGERFDQEKPAHGSARIVNVTNKIDKTDNIAIDGLAVSAKTGAGIEALIDHVEDYVRETFASREPAILTRQRQIEAVSACVRNIDLAVNATNGPLELTSELLRAAGYDLGRLVGKIDVEDLLDDIFSAFCVGK